jgi:predicted nucleic acid-binding protein
MCRESISVWGCCSGGAIQGEKPSLPSIQTIDAESLLRALAIYELHRVDFAEAYLIAQAEATGVSELVSFDRSIDRVGTVARREP